VFGDHGERHSKPVCRKCGEQILKDLTPGDPVTDHPNPYIGNELWWHKDRCWAIEKALKGEWPTLAEEFRRHFADDALVVQALAARQLCVPAGAVFEEPTFLVGDLVRKKKGSQWHGRVVGFYSTELTPRGYAVESATEKGSVQIYPEAALERWNPN